jgi:hypothetical protein
MNIALHTGLEAPLSEATIVGAMTEIYGNRKS